MSTKFQIILTGVFALFIVVGVIVFSMYRGSQGQVSNVIVWGTIEQTDFSQILTATGLAQSKEYSVQYVKKAEETFDNDLVEAIAAGEGPDVFFLPSDKIIKNMNKTFIIPYNVFTERNFKDSFIEGAEIFMLPEGVVAMPFVVDPLVMYWNRAIFNDSKITVPPKYWDQFFNLASVISIKDGSLNILRSAVALGEFSNISHAKEIISTLAMQAGTPITYWSGGKPMSSFSLRLNKPTIPAEAAVNFYTEFSNPAKTSYSWNRSIVSSTNYFLGGDLAMYFGFASEIAGIQSKNPNLNFDVAPMPLSREGGNDSIFGRFYGLAITKTSKNPNAAFGVVSILTSTQGSKAFAEILRLPPVRRDLLAERPTGAYLSVFYDSAIRARGWLDPDRVETNIIFRNMIESVTSGRSRVSEAVARANREISNLLQK